MVRFLKICFYYVGEILYDLYWKIYKSQLPSDCRCLSTDPELVSKMSLLGRILHVFRPILTRRRKHSPQQHNSHNTPPKLKIKYKEHIDSFYDPRNTRMYYSLIKDKNVLQSVSETPKIHLNVNDFSLVQYGTETNISVCHYTQNIDVLINWLHQSDPMYIMMVDHCQFPEFQQLVIQEPVSSMMTIPNAGGSSEYSELVSMEYFHVCFGTTSFIPEMMIKYDIESKICDYITTIQQVNVGVSVTRMFIRDHHQILPYTFALSLLYKKLMGMVLAQRTIAQINQFKKSIIHVWCQSYVDTVVVKQAYKYIISQDIYQLFRDICIICSICTSSFIYTNSSVM